VTRRIVELFPFIGNLDMFHRLTDLAMTLILKMNGQCDVKRNMTLSVSKLSTSIITCITNRPIGLAVILMNMHVSTF